MTQEEHAILEALKDYYEFWCGYARVGAVPRELVDARHNKLISACDAHVAQHDGHLRITEGDRKGGAMTSTTITIEGVPT